MKNDLSNVKVGDKIWTIQDGWTEVIDIILGTEFLIKTSSEGYDFNGRYYSDDKFPSAFLECPFGIEIIEKDTLVWYKDHNHESWRFGYYSHFEDDKHFCFAGSNKSTETNITNSWNILTTENPLL